MGTFARKLNLVSIAGAVAVASTACGGGTAAALIAKTPEYAPPDQATSIVSKNMAQPLVVDWPSADRGKLESEMRRGLVVVHYSDRTMQILDHCTVSATYTYRPITTK